MVRHKKQKKSEKPKEIPKDRDVWHATAIGITVLIDKAVNFMVNRKKSEATPKHEPPPKPQEAEKVAPMLPTFIGEEETFHERLQEQKKASKELLKRLK